MHYILNDARNPIPADLFTWGAWFENIQNRRVAQDIVDGARVSTVFLGIDHRYDDAGPPLLFETMVFPSVDDLNERYCDRYSTWAEAEAGHARAVEMVKRGEIPLAPVEGT